MNLFASNSKVPTKNKSSLFSKGSLSINANASATASPKMSNTELFLRHRTEQYLKHLDASTALFFAERLLSEHDCLSSRLLVAKCYLQLHEYCHSYNVLAGVLRECQTQFQRSLFQHNGNKQEAANQMNRLNLSGKTTPYVQGAFTPNGISDLCYTPIRLEDGASGNNDLTMGFAFATPIGSHCNSNQNHTNSNNESHINLSHNGSMGPQSMANSMAPQSASFLNANTTNCNMTNSTSSMTMKQLLPSSSRGGGTVNEAELAEARYYFALICFELSRYDECEEVLRGKKSSDGSSIPELAIPNGVHGLFLLAKVYHKSGRTEMAIQHYRKCIDRDSYHFGAIMALSELGQNPGLQTNAASNGNGNGDANPMALLSKHCVIPKEEKYGFDDEESSESKMVSLETADPESYSVIKTLFEYMSWGYFKLQIFEPQEALRYFVKLSKPHQESAWCCNNKARCYYEMNDYQRAISEWKRQHELYPFDMKGIDYYSTALWHLKMSKELTLLSQRCTEIGRTATAAWVVMGNCFSLHKSHDIAIRFFRRASMIDPNYAYAYTLAGHEYVVNEDFDNALKAFQCAIRIDHRHYNAWYGLATIYQFQQKYQEALYHFTRARDINPNSSVLLVCIGNIFKLKQQYKEALEYIDKALNLTNATGHHNLKARLERANILILQKQYVEAIDEFKELLQIIPSEWKIHFHLGEVYLKLGNKAKALQAFNHSLALNPKDKNTIKHQIQNIYNATNMNTMADDEYPQSLARRGRGSGSHSFYNRSVVDPVDEDDEKETDDEEMDASSNAISDRHRGRHHIASSVNGRNANDDGNGNDQGHDHRSGASYDFADHHDAASFQFDGFAPVQRESVDAVGPTHSNSLSPTL